MKRETNTVYTTIEFAGVGRKRFLGKKRLFIRINHELNGITKIRDYFIDIGDSITVEQPIDLDMDALKLQLGK